MKVTVTQEDIDKGIPRKGERCAIACALRRKLPGQEVDVGDEEVIINNRRHYRLPMKAREFIYDFDFSEKRVQPIEFEMRKLK